MDQEQKDSGTGTVKGKSVRVALIVSERIVYDYSIFLEHLLVGLADESVRVALVCPWDCDLESVASLAVEIVRHAAFQLPFLQNQSGKGLVGQLEKFKPTVLHCLCESKAPLARRLAKQMDLPYVLAVNSLQRRLGRLCVSPRHLAKIIVPAKSIAANLAEVYPRYAERIEQINIGTFVEEAPGCFCEPGRLACMVTAHRLRKVSDFENLFEAVRHLAIEGYEFMLVVMGGGPAERGVRELLRGLGLSRIVTIVPRTRPWRPVLAAGDIFIQPVASSAFNPFLLEAMSVGAAVAGCEGGVDDLIINEQTAVVFDPDDELSIKDSLQRLMDRRELAQQMAAGAQKCLKENYSVSGMISSILQTYHEAQKWLKR